MPLPICLAGMDANFIVDTGAAVTIVSSRVFQWIDANNRPALRDSALRHLVVSDNWRLTTEGVATLAFNIGGTVFPMGPCFAEKTLYPWQW